MTREPVTRADSFGGDSAWLRDAVADDAAARWREGVVALASAIEAATAAQSQSDAATALGPRLAALYDATESHLEDLDDLASGLAAWPEYRNYVVNLRQFRDDVQAWRFSRGEGRPREGPPGVPGPGERPLEGFATHAWRLVGDAMLLLDLYATDASATTTTSPRAPWWRRWLSGR